MLPGIPPERTPDASEPSASPPSPPEYEFSATHNAVFARTAFWMEWTGRLFIGVGAAAVLLGLFVNPNALLIIEGAGTAVVGVYTWWVAMAFRQVERTRGEDITHVMSAVAHLGKMYAFQLLFLPVLIAALVLYAVL